MKNMGCSITNHTIVLRDVIIVSVPPNHFGIEGGKGQNFGKLIN